MHGRKRVLVLDFDADLLITLEKLLEDSGFSTVTTWDVDEAVELMGTHCFDFFVIGHRPPALDAPALLEHVRNQGVQCGSFILGGAGDHDGISNLTDRIRAYPCAIESLMRPSATSATDQELVGWPR